MHNHWVRLCGAIGREDLLDDPRYADGHLRMKHKADLEAVVTEWTRARTKDEVMTVIGSAGVPAGAVFDIKDLMGSEDMRKRGIMAEVEHPTRGRAVVPAWSVRLSGTMVPVGPAPLLGEHNEQVLGELLGMTGADVAVLREEGAI